MSPATSTVTTQREPELVADHCRHWRLTSFQSGFDRLFFAPPALDLREEHLILDSWGLL